MRWSLASPGTLALVLTGSLAACGGDPGVSPGDGGDQSDAPSHGGACPEPALFPLSGPVAVRMSAMSDDTIYLGSTSVIYEAPPAGEATLFAAADQVQSVAVDASGVYYVGYDDASETLTVRHRSLGSTEERSVAELSVRGTSMTLSADTIYVATFLGGSGGLLAIDKDATGQMAGDPIASAAASGDPHSLATSSSWAAWIGVSRPLEPPNQEERRLWTAAVGAWSEVRYATVPGAEVRGSGVSGDFAFTAQGVFEGTPTSSIVKIDLTRADSVPETIVPLESLPLTLLADDNHIYWLQPDGVYRSDHQGGAVTHISGCTGFGMMQSESRLGVIAQSEDLTVHVHVIPKQ
jgi:hypothetical protein